MALREPFSGQMCDAGDGFPLKKDASGCFVDARSAADRARAGLPIAESFMTALLRELGLEWRIEFLARIVLPHFAKTAAMRAPTVRGVEGKEPRIEWLERPSAFRTIHFRADDVKFSPAVAHAGRPFANFERTADKLPGISSREHFADQRIDRVFLEPLKPRKTGNRGSVHHPPGENAMPFRAAHCAILV